jgi:hypothetical protein
VTWCFSFIDFKILSLSCAFDGMTIIYHDEDLLWPFLLGFCRPPVPVHTRFSLRLEKFSISFCWIGSLCSYPLFTPLQVCWCWDICPKDIECCSNSFQFFSPLIFDWSDTLQDLSSSADILSFFWSSLPWRFSTEFFCLSYWTFHFQGFLLPLFKVSLYWISHSYPALYSWLPLTIYVYSLESCWAFNIILLSSFSGISTSLILLKSVTRELWSLGGFILPCFSYSVLMLRFVHLVGWTSLLLLWDVLLSNENMSLGIYLLCNVEFISCWTLLCNLPVSVAIISALGHSGYHIRVGDTHCLWGSCKHGYIIEVWAGVVWTT